LLLPPWDIRYTAVIEVAQHVSMVELQAFAAQYQARVKEQ
jgi:hypothetical protein